MPQVPLPMPWPPGAAVLRMVEGKGGRGFGGGTPPFMVLGKEVPIIMKMDAIAPPLRALDARFRYPPQGG